MDTALLVLVPEAEPVVGRWRDRLDPAAAWGVPAHVTVLYPFVPLEALDDAAFAVLTAIAAGTPAVDVELARTATFGTDVLWLAPEPAEPFRTLTRAVGDRFPQALPYGGAHGGFDDVVPHLTVADHPSAADLEAARTDVGARLPVRTRVRELTLLAGEHRPGGWRVERRFPLGVLSGQR
ncbi:2'-5' RNA ligase family protein [Kineococcus sp. GCM10028916]|uniref:2'-5' RNA ligase family protein n=1 Tax=Kineococcus sp. GCM10028916 TaxID=3273394 RepID=UPI0036325ECF